MPRQQVKVVDHPDLQDGFGNKWNRNLLSKIIEQEALARGIHAVITFDDYGVSGHCNHRDVHYGVRNLLQETAPRGIDAWELVCFLSLAMPYLYIFTIMSYGLKDYRYKTVQPLEFGFLTL
ncbi:uncharacterized protein LOC115690680 isoform X2 [Syzygium oleosum]|nr:uncharacterized protein LOC115690680 isoform X2 [Syzygium oleosum]